MSNTIVTIRHICDNNVVKPVHILFVSVLLYCPSRARAFLLEIYQLLSHSRLAFMLFSFGRFLFSKINLVFNKFTVDQVERIRAEEVRSLVRLQASGKFSPAYQHYAVTTKLPTNTDS